MLYEKYAAFHGHTVEIENLPQLRARVKLAALKGDAAVEEVIQDIFKDFSKAALERVYVHLHGVQKLEKVALKGLLGGIGALMGLGPLAARGFKSMGQKHKLEEALRQVVRRHPQLAQDPEQTARNFELISHFAPDLAMEPTSAGSMLMQLNALGGAAITPDFIKKIIDIQQLRQPSGHDLMSGGAKAMGTLGGMF